MNPLKVAFLVLPFAFAACSSMGNLIRQQEGVTHTPLFLTHTPDPLAGEDWVDVAKLYYGERSYAGLIVRHNPDVSETYHCCILTTWWGSVMQVTSGKNLPPEKPIHIPFHTVMNENAEKIAGQLKVAGDKLAQNRQYTLAVERYQNAVEIKSDISIPALATLPTKWRNQVRFYQKKRDAPSVRAPSSGYKPDASPADPPEVVIARAKDDLLHERYASARKALTGLNHPEAKTLLTELKGMAESLYEEGLAEYRQQTEESYHSAIAKWKLALECNPSHAQAKQSLIQAQERLRQLQRLQ